MYICVCNAVTDSDIKRAVENGANSMQHLKSSLGVSTNCGSCSCDAKRCLNDVLESQLDGVDLVTY